MPLALKQDLLECRGQGLRPSSYVSDTQITYSSYTTSGVIWKSWNDLAWSDSTASSNYDTSATWKIWTGTSSSYSTVETVDVWPIWALDSPVAEITTGCTTSRVTWDQWNDGWQPTAAPVIHIPRFQETEEQRQDRLRREEEAKAKREAERKIRENAKARAEKLLLSVLDDQQRQDWAGSGHFFLHVGNRKYQIRRGQHGNISLVDKENQELERFCVYTQGDVPDADNALAQMLMLKHDEAKIIGKANSSRLRPGHTSLKQMLQEGGLIRAA